jgi:Leucine-rich repeat (LRR) protein
MKLRKMRGLEQLVNLRQLLLGHNLIDKIEGLSKCKLLEELSLEKNHLHKIEGLECCPYLKKIELGKNLITKIEGMGKMIYFVPKKLHILILKLILIIKFLLN